MEDILELQGHTVCVLIDYDGDVVGVYRHKTDAISMGYQLCRDWGVPEEELDDLPIGEYPDDTVYIEEHSLL